MWTVPGPRGSNLSAPSFADPSEQPAAAWAVRWAVTPARAVTVSAATMSTGRVLMRVLSVGSGSVPYQQDVQSGSAVYTLYCRYGGTAPPGRRSPRIGTPGTPSASASTRTD